MGFSEFILGVLAIIAIGCVGGLALMFFLPFVADDISPFTDRDKFHDSMGW